jgi:hypothetical protein
MTTKERGRWQRRNENDDDEGRLRPPPPEHITRTLRSGHRPSPTRASRLCQSLSQSPLAKDDQTARRHPHELGGEGRAPRRRALRPAWSVGDDRKEPGNEEEERNDDGAPSHLARELVGYVLAPHAHEPARLCARGRGGRPSIDRHAKEPSLARASPARHDRCRRSVSSPPTMTAARRTGMASSRREKVRSPRVPRGRRQSRFSRHCVRSLAERTHPRVRARGPRSTAVGSFLPTS